MTSFAFRLMLAIGTALPIVAAPAIAAAATDLPADGPLTLDQLKQRYGDAASRYARIGGMSIRYKDEGKGPAIVLLHGSYSSLDGYDRLAAALRGRYRIIRFDMPGMGLSEATTANAATETPFGDDVLKALLDRLGVARATLVGVSSGGAIGYVFAARFPDRVNALILANTPADPVFNDKVPRSPELAAEFARARASGVQDRRYWSVYLRWLAADPARIGEAWITRYYDMNRRAPLPGARSFWRSTNDVAPTRAALAGVGVPTLLVWGQHDAVLPPATMDALGQYLRAVPVSTIVLPDVGHYPPFEVPDRFALFVVAFIDGVVGADPRAGGPARVLDRRRKSGGAVD